MATIAIDRPQARNALALRTMEELAAALEKAQREEAHVVVIRGSGTQAFCAGGDLKELESMRDEGEAASMAHRMRRILDGIPQLPMPVIAAVNGDALGGGAELAVACDFRIAAAHARIGFAQVALGLMPAWGSPERLAALVGRARALSILLTAEAMPAERALALGLVEEVVPSDVFDRRVAAVASSIAAAPPAAIVGIKRYVGAIQPHRYPQLEDEAVEEFARTWVDPAHWEAVARMEERRRRKR